MQGLVLATEAIEACLPLDVDTVLDIGSGEGMHAARFREAGKRVTTLDHSDHWGRADVTCRFEDFDAAATFDLIWASHVLEHQTNPGAFLEKLRRHIAPGGWFAITVPPAKFNIVGGHVTIWNEGLLLYNLIAAGFDCSAVSVLRYGYNISVIGQRVDAALPPLRMDNGDIDALARFFPVRVAEGFDGNLQGFGAINWPPRRKR